MVKRETEWVLFPSLVKHITEEVMENVQEDGT